MILLRLADELTASVPSYKRISGSGFQIKDEIPQHFFVFDLTAPANNAKGGRGCINFLDKHLYHFAPDTTPLSLSHILFLDGGEVVIFRSVNCGDPKKNLEAIVDSVKDRLDPAQRQETIQRLKNYRKFGHYYTYDDPVVRCDQGK